MTFPVTVTLEDPIEPIQPGMSADVEITIAQAADVVTVPLRRSPRHRPATSSGRGRDGGVEPRAVTVGLVTETLAEIQSGLAEGEPVVVGTSAERTAPAPTTRRRVASGAVASAAALAAGRLSAGRPREARVAEGGWRDVARRSSSCGT